MEIIGEQGKSLQEAVWRAHACCPILMTALPLLFPRFSEEGRALAGQDRPAVA
ncbi:MAG: hypothetical protein JNL68_16270 [Burkholderiales bacterium]|nr:hypothetical protein [Burkholderiales bacterium]